MAAEGRRGVSQWLVIEKRVRNKWVFCSASSSLNAGAMSEILRSCKFNHPRTKYRMRKIHLKLATSAAARGKARNDA